MMDGGLGIVLQVMKKQQEDAASLHTLKTGVQILSLMAGATTLELLGGGLDSPGTSAEGLATSESGAFDVESLIGAASKGEGNFGLGSATTDEADEAGRAWVGEGYRSSTRDNRILISQDGLRQYRPPSAKPSLGGRVQANFERRSQPSGGWEHNGHLDIEPEN
jgi:hypothetical protein